VEYELSKRTETQIRCTLLNLFHEKKYWEAAGILMEIFRELEDEGAQDLLVILNSERTEANGRGFLEGFLEYTGIFWDRNMRAVPDKWAS
jgi:predicted TIM-barrel enzyme